MNKSNLWLRLGGVLLLCLLCAYYLYPVSQKLKLGIDLDGGSSLLYEIDDSGLHDFEKSKLADQVIEVLKKRVDPDNVRNLVWRPIGANRIEIQMPRPSSEITERRKQFDAAYKELDGTNLTLANLYAALRQAGEPRRQALDAMATVDPKRGQLMPSLVQANDALLAARQAGNQEAAQKAQDELDRVIDALLETNFPMQRLMDSLESGPAGEPVLAKMQEQYPSRKEAIARLVQAYADWTKVKSGLDDPSDLRRMLRGAGVLEFRILAEQGDPDVQQYIQQLQERGPRIRKGDVYGWFLAKEDEFGRASTHIAQKYGDKLYVLAYLSPEKGLVAGGAYPWKLIKATPRYDLQHTGFAVDFQLDEYGGQIFGDLTAHNLHKRLCILLDNEAISAPVIQSRIGTNGQITGNFTQERAQELAQTLNAGALPARLKEPPLSQRSIGPTLGQTNREMGLKASYIGISLVIAFMLFYYLLGGLIADVAMLMNLLLTLGIMAGFEATFTLPGVAGLILSLAMAVDANVLIFERIREETARGAPLRLAIKNGYQRAFSAIFDSNLTTLITTAVLYYFGSEDIKGFALTLGLGLAASMFTAIVVTRMIFELLLRYNLIQSLPMMRLIRVPKIDWWGKRRYFLVASAIATLGSVALYFGRDPQTLYDIEFLGGTSAQIELKQAGSMTDEQVRQMVTDSRDPDSAVSWLNGAAGVMEKATVSQLGAGLFQVQAPEGARPDLNARQIRAFLAAVNSPAIDKNGIQERDARSVSVATLTSANMTLDGVKGLLSSSAQYLRRAADKMGAAQVQTVREGDTEAGQDRLFEIVTTETNEYIVREAIVAVSNDALRIESAVEFQPRSNAAENNSPYFPIVSKDLGDDLHDKTVPLADVREYMGGVALVMDDLKPALTTRNLSRRLEEMRLQPDFQHYAWRKFEVLGLKPAGTDAETKEPTYGSVAIVVTDPNATYDEGRSQWEAQLAQPEMELARAALTTERTLRKVVQFAPQVASQTQQRAILALVLALIAIMAYIWVRFGTLRHGFGAVISLFHDVTIAMGVVALSSYLAYTSIGHALLIGDYKVNLTILAAWLTLVGYSINDTIVVFDRIRENSGRLHEVSPQIFNDSVNQTMSRTLLTGVSALLVTTVMYIWGGPGIQGFAYVMTIGTLVGTYSSIAVASPLLLMFAKGKKSGNGTGATRKMDKVNA